MCVLTWDETNIGTVKKKKSKISRFWFLCKLIGISKKKKKSQLRKRIIIAYTCINVSRKNPETMSMKKARVVAQWTILQTLYKELKWCSWTPNHWKYNGGEGTQSLPEGSGWTHLHWNEITSIIHLFHALAATSALFLPVRLYYWTSALLDISLAENNAMKSLVVICLLVLGMYPVHHASPM